MLRAGLKNWQGPVTAHHLLGSVHNTHLLHAAWSQQRKQQISHMLRHTGNLAGAATNTRQAASDLHLLQQLGNWKLMGCSWMLRLCACSTLLRALHPASAAPHASHTLQPYAVGHAAAPLRQPGMQQPPVTDIYNGASWVSCMHCTQPDMHMLMCSPALAMGKGLAGPEVLSQK
jgi:hypothetical protein